MKKIKIIASGDVQGVGYREAVKEIAMNLDLTGEVKKLDGGSVEVIAEGSKETLERFEKEIKIREYPINVTKISTSFDESAGEFDAFRVIRGNLQEEMFEAISGGTVAVKRMGKTLVRIEKTQDDMKNTQDQMKHTQEDMKNTLDGIKNTQDDMKHTQDDILTHVKQIPAIERNTKDMSNSLGELIYRLVKVEPEMVDVRRVLNLPV